MAKSDGVVRRLVAQLSLEVDDKSVSAADRMLDGITSKLKAFAAIATVVKAADWVAGIIGEADRLNDAAERIGTTTQALQGLGFAADISGSSADSMMQGLKFLTKTIGEAAGGSKEAQKAFHALGVSYKNADGSLKNGADLMPEIADKLASVTDETKRAALSMGVFSRAGQDLAPFLGKGAENIRALQEEFAALGGVFEKSFVDDAALAQDNADKLAVSWKSIGAAIGKAVLPGVNRFTSKLLEWWKEHGPRVREVLGRIFERVADIVEIAAQLLAPWVNLILLITNGWHMIEELIESVEGLMPILKVLGALALLFFAPWLALIAVIALIAEDIYQFATGGESVLGLLVDAAKDLFASLVQGVSDSVDEMLGFFTYLGDELGATFDGFVAGVLGAVDEAIATFMNLGQTVKDIFNGIVASITNAFNELLGLPSKLGAGLKGAFKGLAETFGIKVEGPEAVSSNSAPRAPDVTDPAPSGRGLGGVLRGFANSVKGVFSAGTEPSEPVSFDAPFRADTVPSEPPTIDTSGWGNTLRAVADTMKSTVAPFRTDPTSGEPPTIDTRGIGGAMRGLGETFKGVVAPVTSGGTVPASPEAIRAGASLSNTSSNSVVVNVTANGDDPNLGNTIADHVSRALEADRVSTYNALIGAAQ